MLLYSRKKVRYRRDGYCWKKRKDGKTTREDHMKLKVQGTEVSNINNNFLHHSMFICQSQHLWSGKKKTYMKHINHTITAFKDKMKRRRTTISTTKNLIWLKNHSSFHPSIHHHTINKELEERPPQYENRANRTKNNSIAMHARNGKPQPVH